MASAVESSDVKSDERETEPSDKSETETTEPLELEQGRVWRRGSVPPQIDKHNTGPVLRTTVRPVKRFRPDSSADKTNPSPGRKKRLKLGSTTVAPVQNLKPNSEEGAASQNETAPKPKIPSNAGSSFSSPEEKGLIESACGKVEGEKIQVPENKESVSNAAPAKKKRVWEQWSVEDKNYFFEAVATYGKDFEAIRTAIAQKHRKKGEVCVAKTKDQVRHLYYRTWTMISKIIDTDAYPLNINKAFQELYAVINYGELRKKLGGNLKKKGIEKLNELIRDGTTSTRIKGKNFRIKTPSCRALKKMNPEYQGKEGVLDLPLVSDTRRMKIPLHVTIELCPLTMCAWKQVHSLAHNPRLRIRLSVECHLSSIFTYLEKKWQPLSSRLMSVAKQCQNKNSTLQRPQKNTASSKWDETLVIQTSPEASVNTRIMVFQVTNNKTHCVVSYALRKSMQSAEKLPEIQKNENKISEMKEQSDIAVVNSETSYGCVSESEAVDSCLSSEEECDYDSANEACVKDHDGQKTVPSDQETHSPCTNGQIETLDISFSLKEKEYGASCSPETPESILFSETQKEAESEPLRSETDPNVGDNHIGENTTDGAQNISLTSETDILEKEDAEIDADFHCADKSSTMESKSIADAETCEPEKRARLDPSEICAQNGVEATDNASHTETPTSDAGKGDKSKKGKKLLVSAKLFGKTSDIKKHKIPKKSKAFTKTVQMWSAKDCRKTTIAEIYMMLGKPSVFRLCYHWLNTASSNLPSHSTSVNHDRETASGVAFLSTGLAALMQAAELSRISNNHDGKKAEVSENMAEPTAQKSSAVKTKSTATQCDLIKSSYKVDDKSNHHLSSANSASSNPHGRGVSKIIPVETVIVDSIPVAGFAIPAVPVNRPRRIAANPNKPVQGTKVSAETMNWLLHRERSRSNRQVRKPIMQNRTNSNYKQMKTFSIITCGPNKVGFRPSQPVLAARPTPTDLSSTLGTSSKNAQTTEASLSINKLLHFDASSAPDDDLTVSSHNLLARAAKEAGVAPSTPVKNSESLRVQGARAGGSELQTESTNEVGEVLAGDIVADPTPDISAETSGKEDMPKNALHNSSIVDIEHVITQETQRLSPSTLPTHVASSIPMCLVTSSPVAPALLITSAPVAIPNVVHSLPELSWPGHDIASSAFPIMGDTLIDKLVDGEGDVVLTSLDAERNSKKNTDNVRLRVSPLPMLDDTAPSRDQFDLHMTPVKSSDIAVHPWTINTNSSDTMGLSGLLNTPQKVLPSDTEDSLDGLISKHASSPGRSKDNSNRRPSVKEFQFSSKLETRKSSPTTQFKTRHASQDQSSNFLSDSAVDLQLQCLMNENSIDLVSKFQDLVRHTTGCDELSVLANDENACDGHSDALTPIQKNSVTKGAG